MDPGGSELDSSLPQPENPCLIVEDSQPDSVALEDDPETSYRTLLARRLSSLQPTSRSPVLELISSPPGSISSQTDSQSESCRLVKPAANSISAFQEESQVINICPPPNKRRSVAEDLVMDSGADSTTHCSQQEEGNSQFGFLELSQSQDQYSSKVMNNQQEAIPPEDSEKCTKTAEQNISSKTSGSQNSNSVRSEVSSSSSSDSGTHPVKLSAQALLHSQGLQDPGEPDQPDCEIMSSQEDLFEADKSGVGVDSTMSEPEQQAPPTSTPSHTLRLLHLSGQETLVKESLSQSSVDYVAATPDKFSHTPLIVPSSPTGPENGHGVDEPMDTSLPSDDLAGTKASKTEVASKPQPSASTPVSQSCPGFVLEKSLSIPSQPEFSHDVFVPTQSQDSANSSDKKSASLPKDTPSQCLESTSFTLPLELSVHTENSGQAQQTTEEVDDDSQATQIEEFDKSSCVDVSHSVSSDQVQKIQRNNDVTKSPSLKSSTLTESQKHQIDCNKIESSSVMRKTFHAEPETSSRISNVEVKATATNSGDTVSCSQPKLNSFDGNVNSCVQETPSDIGSLPSQSMISTEDMVRCSVDVKGRGMTNSQSQHCTSVINNSMMDKPQQDEDDDDVIMLEEERADGVSGMAIALSQSQMSPEPMQEDSVIVVTDSEKDSQVVKKDVVPQTNSHQPAIGTTAISANGHQTEEKEVNVIPAKLSQTEKVSPTMDRLKDKSLSDSSGDISFHFTLPKEGELIGPAATGTPPPIKQLKQTLRHSTPIDITSISDNADMVAGSPDAVMAASDIVPADVQEDLMDRGDGKLSLRMKLVTPVEEGSSDSFSLQKPSLTEENGSVIKAMTVSKAVSSSPSVFSRVRQVHRQQKGKDESQQGGNSTLVRGELFASPLISSQTSSLGCNSLPNSQSETTQQEVLGTSQKKPSNNPHTSQQSEERRGPTKVSESATSNNGDAQKKGVSQHATDNTVTSSLSNKLHQRTVSQQTSFDAPELHSPTARSEPASPSLRRTTGPSHCRHVRTIQEVRTTITRIITDVYYEDGKEVERKVTEESEEPVVHCQVLDGDISPCRTGSSSVTSGDLADISSLSSKASSLQHSSGGTSSSTGLTRPEFIVPSSRGARAFRGRGSGSLQRPGVQGNQPSSSEDEPYTCPLPIHLPVSPTDAELPSHSDSLRSSPEEASLAGSSFVGLQVVAKWSSNGYFYSGRIISDAGEGRYRLRFDDGYECEVIGKDILLCDPIPLETEVTALLEDEYFSIGIVKGHKTEDADLFYSVERDGQRQWYNRTSVILSLEQGNKLREQHSLGPYEPSTPLAKASDISLDNLVEGKRRRRVTSEGQNTPNRSSSSSSRTPGTSKRKLRTGIEDKETPAKRGRRGPGARAGTEA